MRKNHCVEVLRDSTSAPQRSQRPSLTCSFASTVWSFGHHLTGAALRYASPRSKQPQEEPLRPVVVLGLVRRELAVPVDRASRTASSPCGCDAMFFSTIVARVPPSLMAAFSAGRPNESKPIGRSTAHAVASAEVREDVADRVVRGRGPCAASPDGYGSISRMYDLLSAGLAGSSGFGVEGALRPPRPAATSPRSLVGSYRSIESRPERQKKPLGFERPGEAVAAPRRGGFPALRKKRLLHCGEDSSPRCANPGAESDARARALPRYRRGRRRRRARARRLARVRSCGRARDAARRLLRGDAPRAGTRISRAPRPRRSSSTATRRSRTSRCCGCSPRRASARMSRRSASSPSRAQPGFPAQRLVMHGNNKSDEELAAARRRALVVLDAPGRGRARARRRRASALLVRVTPGIDADTHEAIRTGHHGSKFGLPPEQARSADRARDRGIRRGLHVHVGSQLLDSARARVAVDWLAAFARQCRAELGWTPQSSTSAAGSASATRATSRAVDRTTFVARARRARARLGAARPCPTAGRPRARPLARRPGRRDALPRRRRQARGARRRPTSRRRRHVRQPAAAALRRAPHRAAREPRGRAATGVYAVAGKHCESGDVLIERVALPEPRRGDLLAVPATGAYTLAHELELQRRPAARGRARRGRRGAGDPPPRDGRRPAPAGGMSEPRLKSSSGRTTSDRSAVSARSGRLARAAVRRQVTWLPYDLHPEYPPEGMPRTDHPATGSARRDVRVGGDGVQPAGHRAVKLARGPAAGRARPRPGPIRRAARPADGCVLDRRTRYR